MISQFHIGRLLLNQITSLLHNNILLVRQVDFPLQATVYVSYP